MMDSKQSELVEKYQESILKKSNDEREENVQSESDDDLLDLLNEDDDIISNYREARIQQLSKEFKKIDDTVRSGEVGELVTLTDEKALMDIVTTTDIVMVHFYQPQFHKCAIMNERLSVLSEKHLKLKILIIKAEDSPFLTTRLNIKVLPFVVIYKSGRELTRIVGFENLGNNPENFTLESLEHFLYVHKVINRKTINFSSNKLKTNGAADDDDDDLDL